MDNNIMSTYQIFIYIIGVLLTILGTSIVFNINEVLKRLKIIEKKYLEKHEKIDDDFKDIRSKLGDCRMIVNVHEELIDNIQENLQDLSIYCRSQTHK